MCGNPNQNPSHNTTFIVFGQLAGMFWIMGKAPFSPHFGLTITFIEVSFELFGSPLQFLCKFQSSHPSFLRFKMVCFAAIECSLVIMLVSSVFMGGAMMQ